MSSLVPVRSPIDGDDIAKAAMDTRKDERKDAATAQIVNLTALATNATATGDQGAVWSLGSTDLNLNLIHFVAGDGVAAHVNAELDVVGVVISGEGTLEVDGAQHELRPGMLFFMPKGARRAISARTDDFAYLTCHRRRAGLMPSRKDKASTRSSPSS